MEKRKRAGVVTAVVPDKDSKHGKYFFSLRVTGEAVTITEGAKMAKLREEGRLDSSGQVI